MESPMDVESHSQAGSGMSTACISKGLLDDSRDRNMAAKYECRVNNVLSLPDDDAMTSKEPSLPADDCQEQQCDELPGQNGFVDLVYDKTCRRSSLGADSVLDQDFSEDGNLDCDGIPISTGAENTLGVQYADDIYTMKKSLESKYHPTNCMAAQPQVTEYMRCTLVHWLIKVNHQLQFGPETVFLAVNIADRFLALTPLAQDCLQLLVVTSLFVAAKMEESIVPGISELVAMCGGTYKPHHFRLMEILILSTLEFYLYGPTSWYFIEHLVLKMSQICILKRRVVNIAEYVLETCLSNYEVSQFLPSVQAAGALMVSIDVVPCSAAHSEVLHEILEDLHSESEQQDIDICKKLMARYMAPFLSCLSLDQQSYRHDSDSPKIQESEEPALELSLSSGTLFDRSEES